MGVKKVQKDAQKIKFSSKVTKFSRKIGIDLTIIFCKNDFLVRFWVFEIWSILYFSLCNAFKDFMPTHPLLQCTFFVHVCQGNFWKIAKTKLFHLGAPFFNKSCIRHSNINKRISFFIHNARVLTRCYRQYRGFFS